MIAFATLALAANAQLCSNIRTSCVGFNVQLPFCNKLRLECRKLAVAGFVSPSFNGTVPFPEGYPHIGCRDIYRECYAKAQERCDNFLAICYKVLYAKSEGRLNTDPPKKL
jgi:hypothetical protein